MATRRPKPDEPPVDPADDVRARLVGEHTRAHRVEGHGLVRELARANGPGL